MGAADAGACQGNISDLRDIPDINAINDAVKNVDKLREHKGIEVRRISPGTESRFRNH